MSITPVMVRPSAAVAVGYVSCRVRAFSTVEVFTRTVTAIGPVLAMAFTSKSIKYASMTLFYILITFQEMPALQISFHYRTAIGDERTSLWSLASSRRGQSVYLILTRKGVRLSPSLRYYSTAGIRWILTITFPSAGVYDTSRTSE